MRSDSSVEADVPTGGRVFRGGQFIELTRDRNGTFRFLSAGGRTGKVVEEFMDDGVTYIAPRLHRSLSDALVLPTSLGEFGSTPKLFNEILELFGPNGSTAIPLAFFVLASWLPEVTPVAPFLWVVMPTNFMAAALKETLRSVCRHSLVVSTVSGSFPALLPMGLQPTLILEIDKPSRREILRASQAHVTHCARGGTAVDPYCAKVVFSRVPAGDLAAAGFPLEDFCDSRIRASAAHGADIGTEGSRRVSEQIIPVSGGEFFEGGTSKLRSSSVQCSCASRGV